MIKELEKIIENLINTENDLRKLKESKFEIDMTKFNEIVQTSINGLNWEKIESKHSSHNCSDCSCTDKIEYLKENNKILEGILLDDIAIEEINNRDGERGRDKELWLLKNGQLKVLIYDYDLSNWQNTYDEKERFIAKDQEIKEFDFNVMTSNIFSNLNSKIQNLQSKANDIIEELKEYK